MMKETCLSGNYTPFDPKDDPELQILAGLCVCEECVEDRRAQIDEPLIVALPPDLLEDGELESLGIGEPCIARSGGVG